MNSRMKIVITIVAIAASVIGIARALEAPEVQRTSLSEEEAEILVYLVPDADQVRNAGCDVEAELQTSSKLDQTNFFTFWLVRTGKHVKCRNWPVDVSYFSVNKRTGSVWDDMPEPHRVTSSTLNGVLKIIRRENGITKATLRKYDALKPSI
jgi:hypothetical protein